VNDFYEMFNMNGREQYPVHKEVRTPWLSSLSFLLSAFLAIFVMIPTIRLCEHL